MTEVPWRQPVFQPPPEPELVFTSLADVRPSKPQWLLKGRIPYGSLTVVGGAPGKGKSQFTLKLAADLSAKGTPSIFVANEDDPGQDVRPRVLAAGGKLELVRVVAVKGGGAVELPTHIPMLKRGVVEQGAALVVVDPLAAHLSTETNSNNDHSLRQAIGPLAQMARDTGAAVVVIAHFRKGRDGSPLDWIGGSGGLVGRARSVFLFGEGPDNDEWMSRNLRYLVHIKSNASKLAPTMVCEMHETVVRDVDRGGKELYIPSSHISFDPAEATNVKSGDLK